MYGRRIGKNRNLLPPREKEIPPRFKSCPYAAVAATAAAATAAAVVAAKITAFPPSFCESAIAALAAANASSIFSQNIFLKFGFSLRTRVLRKLFLTLALTFLAK